jgi:hypothetical protein
MRLRQLFEASSNEVAIIFGRFNPPHMGHKAAWELASQSTIWYVGTNESTVGPKDPLPYDVKVEAMKAVWPEVASHIMPETGWLTMASKIYEQYPKATLLALTDEDWVTKTLIQYNGKEGQHGFYNFKNIEQKLTPRLSSATALRDAVIKGDRDAFSKAAGVSADTPVDGKPFFDLVAEYLLPYADTLDKIKISKDRLAAKKAANKKVPESTGQLSVQQLATISDEALDKAYGYGRSSPGNTFGWQANLKSAAYAKQMIDKGVTDIEAISDAIHKGWNVTAKAFVQNPNQFDDTEKLRAAGKLDAKLQQREKLMNIAYAQLPDDEKEKDRVVARALLTAIKGEQGATEGLNEFAPGSGSDDDAGDDPYKYPKPESYRRSIDYFGRFEADHFDREDFDDDTGVFKGYWGRTQIAYFKFDNPRKTGSDDPGMGWYYEPESDGNDDDTDAKPAVDNSAQRKQQELSMINAFLKSGQKAKPGSQIHSLMKRHGVSERVRDPEDWDEGNTEPGNNFAVYINGKKWKVLPGPAGAYADSAEERRELQRLKDMAQRKSRESGKKWEVYITGEPVTR